MSGQLSAVLFGLLSALIWGGGDFCGGLATRRASVIQVLLIAESSGLLMLIGLALAWGEPWLSPAAIGWSMAAGSAGLLGLSALYRGLAVGRAGLVAPVSAVLAAALPALFSGVTAGWPDHLHLLGFALALLAIWLVAQSGGATGASQGLGLALVAGCGFGSFFILINKAGADSTFWPLVVARATTLPPLLTLFFYYRMAWPTSRPLYSLATLSGFLDAGGNAFFVLAAQAGRLDVAAMLSSLYPASTVILASLLLGERTTWVQRSGIVVALAAIALIAA
ncbi:MAG: EamA family transporter [Chloroflexota bacterium]|nr:EamA family transporter [Chloroflexota bacterium]